MAKGDIWMPLYIGDYLADTTRLTTEQHGAYLLLLMDYWRSGPLPDDDKILSQITRMSLDAWGNASGIIRGYFTAVNGQLHHSRVDIEIEKARQNADTAQERARKGANARWGKDAPSNAPSIGQALPMQCPSPSPSPSSLPSELSKNIAPTALVGTSPRPVNNVPFKDIITIYHSTLPELPKVAKLTAKRQGYIRQRWAEDLPTLDDWKEYFQIVRKSDFLMGRAQPTNGRSPFIADIEFLTNASNIVKIIEGKYHR